MAKNFLVDINLNKNELQNGVIQNLASAPNNAVAGQIYYDTTDSKLKVYDGSDWVMVGKDYTLPVATSSILGGVLAKAYTAATDTVEVTIDSSGKLYVPTYPTLASLGGLASSEKGAVNGVAELDAAGKVPSSQLPSYVDDVIEGYYYNGSFYEESSHTTVITPETGKIYVDIAENKSYRWSGTAYIEIAQSTIHKYTGTCEGDGTTTSFTINHGLSTREVIVNVYDATTYEEVMVDIVRATTSTVTVTFASAPASGTDYTVVVIA